MDFLKKKMKEMLSDDDKDKEKKDDHGSGGKSTCSLESLVLFKSSDCVRTDHGRDVGGHGQSQSSYSQPSYGAAPPQHGIGGGPPSGPQLPPGKTAEY